MKKILYLLFVLLIFLVSCTPKEPLDNTTTDNKNYKINNENIESTDEPFVKFVGFDYEITASDWESIANLSYHEKALNFLSALCLSDENVLSYYLSGQEVIHELLKVKADALTSGGRTVFTYYGDKPYEEYEIDVFLKINESESTLFPVGEYEYTLRITDASAIFAEYFCPTEDYKLIFSSKINEKNVSSGVYQAYSFAESVFRFNQSKLSASAVLSVEDNFDSLYHIAIHDLMERGENFVFSTTLENFKDYASVRYGITDEQILNRFANRLKNATYAECDENGVYQGSCAHGYSTIIREIIDSAEDDKFVNLTYLLYADSARLVPCAKVEFVFKKNADKDILTLNDVAVMPLNDFEYIVVAP